MSMIDEENDEPLEFEVEVIAASERALLVRLDDDAGQPMEIWIPKSQLVVGTEVAKQGDVGTLWIPAWLARKKGIA